MRLNSLVPERPLVVNLQRLVRLQPAAAIPKQNESLDRRDVIRYDVIVSLPGFLYPMNR